MDLIHFDKDFDSYHSHVSHNPTQLNTEKNTHEDAVCTICVRRIYSRVKSKNSRMCYVACIPIKSMILCVPVPVDTSTSVLYLQNKSILMLNKYLSSMYIF